MKLPGNERRSASNRPSPFIRFPIIPPGSLRLLPNLMRYHNTNFSNQQEIIDLIPTIMTKYLLPVIAVLANCLASNAQTSLEAKYIVTQNISISLDAGKTTPITLPYEGRVFQQGNKALLYTRPLYLDQYPDGKIAIPIPGGVSSYSFSQDTIYFPELYDTDSSKKWSAYNNPGGSNKNEYILTDYQPGQLHWEIINETKQIAGYNCQRAKLYNFDTEKKKQVFWDIWFCKDIPFPFFFFGIRDIPGLVIEADNLQGNFHYLLKTVDRNKQIPDSTFWPPLFQNVSFVSFIKPTDSKEKSKQDKRQKIMAD